MILFSLSNELSAAWRKKQGKLELGPLSHLLNTLMPRGGIDIQLKADCVVTPIHSREMDVIGTV